MLTIYGIPISVHTRKAIVTAILKGIEYKVEPVIPFNPPPDWRALSPTGLIPVIRDGDFTLADSTAICLYLNRKRPAPPLLPDNAAAFGQVIWFDSYAGHVFRHLVHGLFFQKVVRPAILIEETDQAAVDDLLERARPQLFGYLDGRLDHPFPAGVALTLADIAIVSNLINYQYLGYTIDAARYPRLARYARDIVAHTALQKALADEEPFAEQMGLKRDFIVGELSEAPA